MLKALSLCGASLDDYLHLLVPPIVKVFDTSYPADVRRLVAVQNVSVSDPCFIVVAVALVSFLILQNCS